MVSIPRDPLAIESEVERMPSRLFEIDDLECGRGGVAAVALTSLTRGAHAPVSTFHVSR